MTSFEFAFSLFGLVLGLSVAEVMSGFARVMRARRSMRLGWLTPLLGILLMVDLVTFWSNAWDMRAAIPPSFWALLYGTGIAAVYFLSASLVFPNPLSEWPDLDAYFLRHKGQVMIGVLIANLLVLTARVLLYGNIFTSWTRIAVPVVYTAIGLWLVRTQDKRLSIVLLCVLLAMYARFRLL
ncbi:hypothetical protein [Sphingomonas hengshuiensis]|uniref:hypothetical protein n=1 Tax=Sphingomonas hengshuiensis TaxID=1609977 RepID=UPI000B17BEAB|nr:hypothetical protein [Sphingomonas hengshuiensis]